MTKLTEITQALAAPFPIEEISLLPKGKVERDGKTLCMAMPYADPRAYQDRLNALAPGEWSTPAPLAQVIGDKLVVFVTVTICNVSHTDVGEAGPGENQGTEAWAQAFKRACSQFGYSVSRWWINRIALHSLDRTGDSPYPCFYRSSMLPISNDEDLYVSSCFRVRLPARGQPSLLAGTAVASGLVPFSAFHLTGRGKA
jgi:hypothetical protein